MKAEKGNGLFGFGKNVFVTGLVSFFMDLSSEMIYPLIPLFLANTLGASKSMIGLIEGIAESTASLLKVFSGWFSDRIGNRKWLMAVGYGISTLSRPFVAIATGWQQVPRPSGFCLASTAFSWGSQREFRRRSWPRSSRRISRQPPLGYITQ